MNLKMLKGKKNLVLICIFLMILIFANYILFFYINGYTYLGIYNFAHFSFIPNPIKLGIVRACVVFLLVVCLFVLVISLVNNKCNKKGNFTEVWKYIVIGVLLLLWSISVIPVCKEYYKQCQIVRLQNKLDYEKTVIHACGAIIGEDGNEYTYVNCVEALQNSLDKNNRFIEIDFDWTSDNKLVCYHYIHEEITEKDFLAQKDYDQFTRMNVDDLANIMKMYPDLYVITDIKGDNVEGCRYIAEKYPDLRDNFIVQVYHDTEFEPINELGYKYIILTLYGTSSEEREIPALRKNYTEHDYLGITFWTSWTEGRPAYFEGIGIEELNEMYEDAFYRCIQEIGMPVYVHTENDREMMKHQVELGVSAIYTDNTDNMWLRQKR